LGDIFQTAECAGQGMEAALSFLHDGGLFETFDPDVVFYDVPGEILCGGLAAPLRNSLVDKAYVVSSPDIVSLYTANSIFSTISRYADKGGARLGGIIANGLTTSFAESYIADFAAQTKAPLVSFVPRSLTILQSELYGKTVIEAAPLSNQAYLCRKLAQQIVESKDATVPEPLSPSQLRMWARQWGDRIFELETGIIREGASI
ncbi:MAG TPA: nitrogenase iron protein, partial [Geobacteraceae bacterium]